MNQPASDVPTPGDELTSKILAYVGSVSIGIVASINVVIAGVAIFTGNLIGAIGDVSAKTEGSADLAASAHHAALVAKLVAIGFALLGGLGFVAGAFIRRRRRHLFVPIALAITIAGELGFSIWGGHFTSLDAIMIGCTLFAGFIWYRLPRTLPPQPAFSSRW
jgi:hypothetical protein